MYFFLGRIRRNVLGFIDVNQFAYVLNDQNINKFKLYITVVSNKQW